MTGATCVVGVADGGPVARDERSNVVRDHGCIQSNRGWLKPTSDGYVTRAARGETADSTGYRISSVSRLNPGNSGSADTLAGASRRSGGESGRYTNT